MAQKSTNTHTGTDEKIKDLTWGELGNIADAIASNSNITNDTEEVTITYNGGTPFTIGVGDYKMVTYNNESTKRKIRILGFNHDELTTARTVKGKTLTKAGISFEFVDFMYNDQMNTGLTNSGGWGASAMRANLNNETGVQGYAQIEDSLRAQIKKVNKDYIPTCNVASTTKSSDYLWLLSCSEIWSNGHTSEGCTNGYAKTEEGTQYKYYKKINATYNSDNGSLKKPDASSVNNWWLRSPFYYVYGGYCYITSDGFCSCNDASRLYGVAPGLSI